MLYFKLIKNYVDTTAIRQELITHDDAWLKETGRQERAPAQKDTNAIPLRGLKRSAICGRRRRDVHESRYTSISTRFPETVRLLESLATEFDGELGRAKLARVPPGKKVLPHVDRGEYYRSRDRYHLVIRSEKGSPLQAGGEEIRMQEGELWWFNNNALHAAHNDSHDNRVHLIFDVLPKGCAIDLAAEDQQDQVDHLEIEELLRLAWSEKQNGELEFVVAAVKVYLAARMQPKRWVALLTEHRLLENSENHPLAAVVALCGPAIRGKVRRHYESALAWCLAQIDLDRVRLDDLVPVLAAAGGLETIHVQWKANRDQLLYGKC
ncbi:MAG: aspartyl/asparaginyl beta-hydroxylase domain-containing protein [Nitrosomonas sp.]|nr:aspartyl/asparaginyl beta-hydroxylase domain-containing protein [Nitrosomonas sp.]